MTNPTGRRYPSEPLSAAGTGDITVPSAKQVADFHRNADTDRRPESLHHTLGKSHNQGAYGDHLHDGTTGQLLFDPVATAFNQNLGTDQGLKDAVKQLIQAFVAMGAADLSTVVGSYPEIRTGLVVCNFAVAGTASTVTTLTLTPAMSGAPNIVLTPRNSNATIAYYAKIMSGVANTGTTIGCFSSASSGAGTNVSVDYIAIRMVPYG